MRKILRFFPAIVLSVAIISATLFNAWLFMNKTFGEELVVLILGAELLIVLGLVWFGVVFFELKIFRPLHRLQDQLGVFLTSDADHLFDMESGHQLGELPESVEELARQLARERRDTARAMNAVADRVEHRKSRLEAILRDLHEGVIVCNGDHRIVLFNQSAAMIFERAGPIGLHRPLSSLLSAEAVRKEYARLKHKLDAGQEMPTLAKFKDETLDGRTIEIRMSLIVEQEGGSSGYVLSFQRGDEEAAKANATITNSILSDRPEFYDFSLFESQYDTSDLDRNLNDLDYVVFDTETTGLHPSKGDQIVQISGVRLVKGKPTGEEFDTLVNPGVPIPSSSIRFHGITDDMVVDAPSISDAIRSFKSFVEGAVLVAHNAAFDMKFLKLREVDAGVVFNNPVLDSLLISYLLQPNHTAHTLDAIASRFGVNIADEVRHTALGDARATADVFVKMLPALHRNGLETLGQVMEASSSVFHIRKQQERL